MELSDKIIAVGKMQKYIDTHFDDLKKIDIKQLPYFDILIAGFPCQGLGTSLINILNTMEE